MQKKILSLLALVMLLAGSIQAKEKLLAAHKDWLELVSPIITKIEKDVFNQLETSREREKFIRLFWKRRDPLPDTKKNEFYEEYMRRVRFADKNFGRNSVKHGSKTERGYFYILLGPPLSRQIFATESKVWPLELWQYKGDPRYGLPPYFYLIFFQENSLGEYKLYSPGIEGPQKLVVPGMMDQGLDRSTAYQALKTISGELAGASLTYLPGETGVSGGSLSSLDIIASIHALPEKKFSDAYARNFLYYKDFVETEYTHNYMECAHVVKVFRTAGQDFIHWSIVPAKVNLSFHRGKYYAELDLVIRVEDRESRVIFQKEENIPLSISQENQAKFEHRLMAFQDIFPIIPGKYTLFFLLQNKTAKDFVSFQTSVTVTGKSGSQAPEPFLLYQSREDLSRAQKNKWKAFSFFGRQYIFNNQNSISRNRHLGIFGQLPGLKNHPQAVLHLDFQNLDTAETVLAMDKSLDQIRINDGPDFDTGLLDLNALTPGYYEIRLTLQDKNGLIRTAGKEHFILTNRPLTPLPRIYSKLHSSFPNAPDLYSIATQFFKTKNYVQAQKNLEASIQMKSTIPAQVLLARIFFARGLWQKSLNTAIPIFDKTRDREAGKTIAAAYAELKDWTSALAYLEDLMKEAQEIPVLNLAAECYLNTGRPAKALPLLEKSLKLNPKQPDIRKKVQTAREAIKFPSKPRPWCFFSS